jgi:hypothetical protein
MIVLSSLFLKIKRGRSLAVHGREPMNDRVLFKNIRMRGSRIVTNKYRQNTVNFRLFMGFLSCTFDKKVADRLVKLSFRYLCCF